MFGKFQSGKGLGRGDWLEQWLLQLPTGICDRVLMITWRIWFARNEVTHENDLPSIEGSRSFICSYMRSLENIRNATTEQIIKGKQNVGRDSVARSPVQPASHVIWTRPADGELKLKIDRAFVAQTMEAGAGMILRCSGGWIVFSACRALRNCTSALEAELLACLKGARFATDTGLDCTMIETDW
jgi:hypothetical protein